MSELIFRNRILANLTRARVHAHARHNSSRRVIRILPAVDAGYRERVPAPWYCYKPADRQVCFPIAPVLFRFPSRAGYPPVPARAQFSLARTLDVVADSRESPPWL